MRHRWECFAHSVWFEGSPANNLPGIVDSGGETQLPTYCTRSIEQVIQVQHAISCTPQECMFARRRITVPNYLACFVDSCRNAEIVPALKIAEIDHGPTTYSRCPDEGMLVGQASMSLVPTIAP